MSELLCSHRTRNLPVTVGTAVQSSTAMLMGDMAAGMVIVEGVTVTHTLTVYGSSDGTTFAPLYGHDGQAAAMPVAADGGACVMPDAVYPLRFVKLVADASLGTAATVVISLKS